MGWWGGGSRGDGGSEKSSARSCRLSPRVLRWFLISWMKLPASSASSAYCSLHIEFHQTFSRERSASARSARGTLAAKRGLFFRLAYLRRRGGTAPPFPLSPFPTAPRRTLLALPTAAPMPPTLVTA